MLIFILYTRQEYKIKHFDKQKTKLRQQEKKKEHKTV